MNCSGLSQVDLQDVLVKLGFRNVVGAPSKQKILEHRTSDTIVVLSWTHPEISRPGVVAGVRRLLDEKGIIDKDDFDVLARQIKANPAQPI
jgi:hypothetical protein